MIRVVTLYLLIGQSTVLVVKAAIVYVEELPPLIRSIVIDEASG